MQCPHQDEPAYPAHHMVRETTWQPMPHSRPSLVHSHRPSESTCPGWEGGGGEGLGDTGGPTLAQTDREADEPTEDGTTRRVVPVITVLWQVGCSGQASPQTLEFAPPSPLAAAGPADGVSRLTNQVRRRPTTGHSPHPPQPTVHWRRGSWRGDRGGGVARVGWGGGGVQVGRVGGVGGGGAQAPVALPLG